MIELGGTEYLTVAEVADLKGVSTSAIYKAMREGRLDSVDVLGRSLIPRSSALAYEPGSYGESKRSHKKRGPGRPSSAANPAA